MHVKVKTLHHWTLQGDRKRNISRQIIFFHMKYFRQHNRDSFHLLRTFERFYTSSSCKLKATKFFLSKYCSCLNDRIVSFVNILLLPFVHQKLSPHIIKFSLSIIFYDPSCRDYFRAHKRNINNSEQSVNGGEHKRVNQIRLSLWQHSARSTREKCSTEKDKILCSEDSAFFVLALRAAKKQNQKHKKAKIIKRERSDLCSAYTSWCCLCTNNNTFIICSKGKKMSFIRS